jgi:glycosyltransferase 2 family protein
MTRVRAVLRILLAIFLLILLGWQFADWQRVREILSNTTPLFLIGCVVIYFAGVALSCYKWQILLYAQQYRVPFWMLFRWYLLGALASNLLPSSIGGDLGRGVVAGRGLNAPVVAWTSILAERLTGLLTLVGLALLVLLIAPERFGWALLPALLWIPAAAAGVALVSVGVWILIQRNQLPLPLPQWLTRHSTRLAKVVACYRQQPQVILQSLGLSLLFHCMNCLSLWLTARAVMPMAPFAVGLAYPIIDLAGLIPLTPGGLGIREGATTLLLERVGVTRDAALAAAIVSRTLLWLVSLSGLPVLLAELRTPTPGEGI